VNVVLSADESTSILPRCALTILSAMYNPRPRFSARPLAREMALACLCFIGLKIPFN
jgi:hypothetical protein